MKKHFKKHKYHYILTGLIVLGVSLISSILLFLAASTVIQKDAYATYTRSISLACDGFKTVKSGSNKYTLYSTVKNTSNMTYYPLNGNINGTYFDANLSVDGDSRPSSFYAASGPNYSVPPGGNATASARDISLLAGHKHTINWRWENVNFQMVANCTDYYTTPSTPPTAPKISLSSVTRSSTKVSWTPGSSGSGSLQNYSLYKSGDYYAKYSAGTRSATIKNLTCGHSYSVYVKINSTSGQANSNIITARTSNCPSPPKSSPPSNSSSPPSRTSKNTNRSSSTSIASLSSPKTDVRSSSDAKAKPQLPPSQPQEFSARAQDGSSQIELTWQASSGSQPIHYSIKRSLDGEDWQPLDDQVYDTHYRDMTTDFSMTYQYRLYGIDDAGRLSKPVMTSATSGSFAVNAGPGKTLRLTSDDGHFTAIIGPDSLKQKANCTVDKAPNQPLVNGAKTVLGPYSIICQLIDSSYVNEFAEPVSASVDLDGVDTSKMANIKLASYKGIDIVEQAKSGYQSAKNLDQLEIPSNQVNFIVFGQPKATPQWLKAGLFIVGLLVLLAIGYLCLRHLQARAARKQAEDQAMDYWRKEHGISQ